MTTSTPPAWAWLDLPIAYPANALPIHSRNLPDSDGLREQNDSLGCDVSCSPVISCDRKHDATGCDEAAQVTDSVSNAAPSHRIGTCYLDPDTGETVMPGDFFGEKELRWMPDKDGNRHDAEPLVTVAGPSYWLDKVKDRNEEPAVETHDDLQGKDADKMVDTFDVPFRVQEFMFEELAEVQAEYLHDILKDHTPLIVEMARDRFRKGFAKYGSAAYRWDAETRLTNVLEELADSVVYLTTGAIE